VAFDKFVLFSLPAASGKTRSAVPQAIITPRIVQGEGEENPNDLVFVVCRAFALFPVAADFAGSTIVSRPRHFLGTTCKILSPGTR
jgi:hypothetical protein